MTSPPAAPRAARDRLNLIEMLTADAVASDYAGVGSRRSSRSRRQQWIVASAALALAGFVLALGVSDRVLNAPVVESQRQALMERVEAAQQANDGLEAQLDAVRADVEAARESNLALTSQGRALAERIAGLELVTGYAAATGPGIVVTLSDPPADSGRTDEVERVLDSDVQLAVNGLWASGAEAMAINGHRVSSRTAIRSAAGAILVNYRPLSPPYVIEAIGPPDSLETSFPATPDAAELRGISQQFGIGFDTAPADTLVLPAATSALPEVASAMVPTQGEEP